MNNLYLLKQAVEGGKLKHEVFCTAYENVRLELVTGIIFGKRYHLLSVWSRRTV